MTAGLQHSSQYPDGSPPVSGSLKDHAWRALLECHKTVVWYLYHNWALTCPILDWIIWNLLTDVLNGDGECEMFQCTHPATVILRLQDWATQICATGIVFNYHTYMSVAWTNTFFASRLYSWSLFNRSSTWTSLLGECRFPLLSFPCSQSSRTSLWLALIVRAVWGLESLWASIFCSQKIGPLIVTWCSHYISLSSWCQSGLLKSPFECCFTRKQTIYRGFLYSASNVYVVFIRKTRHKWGYLI